jgi:hypothetical protein
MPLKVLDFGRHDPFRSRIGKPRHLAWPVNAYRVTLPKESTDGDHVNPFDRVILKLLAALGPLDANALSRDTCIPIDLVKGILLRLKDNGVIDDSHSIQDLGDDSSSERDEAAPVFVTAVVFRELVAGKVLPFIRRLDDQNPLKLHDEDEFFAKGKTRRLRASTVHERIIPTVRDVINACRGMHKRASLDGDAAALPPAQMIMVSPHPALYYLDCPIAITRQDGDFRIADPLGDGFSLSLETAFTQLLEQDQGLATWLRDWKETLRNPRPRESDTPDSGEKEPFDNDANWQRYPRLVANLRPAENAAFRSLSKIYASIEWALFYACSRRPFEKAIALLTFADPVDHPALLADAAQRIGLRASEVGLRAIPRGKLLDFQAGKAELGTVFAVSLLQAAQDHSHPIRKIASQHLDVIDLVFGIKKRRDGKGHGQGAADAPEAEQASDPLMREIVNALLPDIRFAATAERQLDEDLRGDSLLDARASIQDEFGFRAFNSLAANVQERLIHAERFWQSCSDGDDALGFANDLYGAVQAMLKTTFVGRLPPALRDSAFLINAQENAVNAQLCEELPECLRTVKAFAIRQTLQGAAQTLGSCVIAFLLLSTQDTLRAIAEAQPSFIYDIELILTCRKHGNEPLPLPKTGTERLRRASFTTIRTLLEV